MLPVTSKGWAGVVVLIPTRLATELTVSVFESIITLPVTVKEDKFPIVVMLGWAAVCSNLALLSADPVKPEYVKRARTSVNYGVYAIVDSFKAAQTTATDLTLATTDQMEPSTVINGLWTWRRDCPKMGSRIRQRKIWDTNLQFSHSL